MPRCDLSIELDRTGPLLPGESIEGHVEVFTDGGVRCESLDLTWGWEADGKFVTTTKVVTKETLFSDGELPGPGSRQFPFRVDVPDDGPFTYDGRYLTVGWLLKAEAEIPWSFDPDAEKEVEVVVPPAIGAQEPADVAFDDSEELPEEAPGLAMPILGGIVGILFFLGGGVAAGIGIAEEELVIGIFGGVFSLAGLFTLFQVVRSALAGRRTGPTRVTVTPERLRPGQAFVARVTMIPPGELRIRGITARLRGYEKVRSKGRSFSSSSSNRRRRRYHTFHSEEVELAGAQTLPGGRPFRAGALLPVPPDASPSFFSNYNNVLWTVVVRVRIPWWSDLVEQFDVQVGI